MKTPTHQEVSTIVPKDHVKSLAHKLAEAKSEGERLRAVEEGSRRLLLEFKREAIERALSLVVERVLGARWQRRGKRIIPWNCRVCGSRWASQVRRHGHCRRHVAAGEGDIEIRVPQGECKGCGRSIAIAGGLLKPRSRHWIELDQRVTELYMTGVSHRKVVEILARRIQSSFSPMTSWGSLQRVGERVRERQEAPQHKVTTVALDHVTHRVRGRRRYTPAAQNGQRGEWLAMRVSQTRDEEAWVTLLDELFPTGSCKEG